MHRRWLFSSSKTPSGLPIYHTSSIGIASYCWRVATDQTSLESAHQRRHQRAERVTRDRVSGTENGWGRELRRERGTERFELGDKTLQIADRGNGNVGRTGVTSVMASETQCSSHGRREEHSAPPWREARWRVRHARIDCAGQKGGAFAQGAGG